MTGIWLGLVLLPGAPALKDRSPPQDLTGEWVFETGERQEQVPEVPYRYRFNKDGTWTVFRGVKEEIGPRGFKADPSVVPPAVDFNTPPADRDSPLVRGIYRIDGDRLTICCARPGAARPTAFGGGEYVQHLRRVKPSD